MVRDVIIYRPVCTHALRIANAVERRGPTFRIQFQYWQENITELLLDNKVIAGQYRHSCCTYLSYGISQCIATCRSPYQAIPSNICSLHTVLNQIKLFPFCVLKLLVLWLVYGPYWMCVGRVSSVGIATQYGLGGPRIESRWTLRPTQPLIQWVPGLISGVKEAGALRWTPTPI